jgi:hypothetical protein
MKGVILGVCLLAAWLATSIAAAETWVADEWRLTEVVERTEGAELPTVDCPLPEEEACCLRLWIVRPPAAGVRYWAVRSVPRYLRPWWLRGPVRRVLSLPWRL